MLHHFDIMDNGTNDENNKEVKKKSYKLKLKIFGRRNKFSLENERIRSSIGENHASHLIHKEAKGEELNIKEGQRKMGLSEKDKGERQRIKNDLKQIIMAEHMNEYSFD